MKRGKMKDEKGEDERGKGRKWRNEVLTRF